MGFFSKQDPYASSIFNHTEIDSAPGSSWSWCDPCEQMMPAGHTCGKTKIASTSDPEQTEDIDYWSVEAVVRGWHGPALKREAKQRLRNGDYDEKKTKLTKWL
jgi:hypothetical protein